MSTLKSVVLSEFAKKKILVIGDLMVDEYITGSVKRISPEAPVPVLDYTNRKLSAGGASNVAHNLAGLGAQVMISGVVADDDAGKWLRNHFTVIGIEGAGVVSVPDRPTTLKTRFATRGQQLLRVDRENASPISEQTAESIYQFLSDNATDLDAVVLSDYRKGVLADPTFVQRIIALCKENKIIITIDSKSRTIEAFRGADFVKPNNLELEDAVGIKITDEPSLNLAGESYLEKSGANALIVTRGKRGISLFRPDALRTDFPARDVEVYDVCGAGDTVISTITLGLAAGLSLEESVELANTAAGIVISKVGTVAVTAEELSALVENQ